MNDSNEEHRPHELPKVEFGIPVPPKRQQQRKKGMYVQLLDDLTPGGSVVLNQRQYYNLRRYASYAGDADLVVHPEPGQPHLVRVFRELPKA